MRIFTKRLEAPEKNNPYYNTTGAGGYSRAIIGKPTCEGLNVLSNCVGYAYGRFHEICGDTSMSLLCPVNAEEFIDYANSALKVGYAPKLGACAVWQKGEKGGHDGAGHVAIVEQINSDGSIVTSESGWNCTTAFWTKNRKNDGNWGQDSSYTFLGFIYQMVDYALPINNQEVSFTVVNVHKGMTGDAVKKVQIILKGMGFYSGDIDCSAGPLTDTAIRSYQRVNGLAIDGDFGPKSWECFLKGD